MNAPAAVWSTTSPVSRAQVHAVRPLLEKAERRGWSSFVHEWVVWTRMPVWVASAADETLDDETPVDTGPKDDGPKTGSQPVPKPADADPSDEGDRKDGE